MRILLFPTCIALAAACVAQTPTPKSSTTDAGYSPTAIDSSSTPPPATQNPAPAGGSAQAAKVQVKAAEDEDLSDNGAKPAAPAATAKPAAPTPPKEEPKTAEPAAAALSVAPSSSTAAAPTTASPTQVAIEHPVSSDQDLGATPEPAAKAAPREVVCLQAVPGQTLDLPGTASRTLPERTPFLWSDTPLAIALDEIARLNNLSIEAVNTQSINVSGDYRKAKPQAILDDLAKRYGLKVVHKKNVYVVSQKKPVNVVVAGQAPNVRAVSLNVTKLYYVPSDRRMIFLKAYDKAFKPGCKILPVSAPNDEIAVYRVSAVEKIHSVLESAAKEAANAKRIDVAKEDKRLQKERDKLLKERADLLDKSASGSRDW